jgi:Protein of unknown function (DUF3089)
MALLLLAAACGGDAENPGAPTPSAPLAPPSAGGSSAGAAAPATSREPDPSATQEPPRTPSAGSSNAGAMAADPAPAAEPHAGAAAPMTTDPTPAEPPETITLMVDAEREHMYDEPTNWLCLPGSKDELCTTDLDTTIVLADGTTELEPHVVATEPAFDCFYVYPTVSNDSGSNSDLMADMEEIDVVRAQAARYTRTCRMFAPLYRQVTLGALNGGTITDEARMLGYRDVVAAFNRYLTEYNAGRGFVLIGHSQGSGVLRRLITDEIDGRDELRKRLIAAHLLGTSVAVPEGMDVGGDFKHVPVCHANDQFGCVLAYATFRADSPPPSNSRFGKVMSGRAVCANPAALGGGAGILTPYFFSSQAAFSRGAGEPIETPFVSFPEFLQAECVESGEFTYLSLEVLSDPADPRVDDIDGDITADWGLHLVDVHIAMGTLVDLATTQHAAFAAQP